MIGEVRRGFFGEVIIYTVAACDLTNTHFRCAQMAGSVYSQIQLIQNINKKCIEQKNVIIHNFLQLKRTEKTHTHTSVMQDEETATCLISILIHLMYSELVHFVCVYCEPRSRCIYYIVGYSVSIRSDW